MRMQQQMTAQTRARATNLVEEPVGSLKDVMSRSNNPTSSAHFVNKRAASIPKPTLPAYIAEEFKKQRAMQKQMTAAIDRRVQVQVQVSDSESTENKAKAKTSESQSGKQPPKALYAIFGQTAPPPPPKIDKSKLSHQKAVSAFDEAVKEESNQEAAGHLEDHATKDDESYGLEDNPAPAKHSGPDLIPGVTVAPTSQVAERSETLMQVQTKSHPQKEIKPNIEEQMTRSFDSFLQKKQQEYFAKAKSGVLPPGDSFFNNMVKTFTSSIQDDSGSSASPAPVSLLQKTASDKSSPKKAVKKKKIAEKKKVEKKKTTAEKKKVKKKKAKTVEKKKVVKDKKAVKDKTVTKEKKASKKVVKNKKAMKKEGKHGMDKVAMIEEEMKQLTPAEREKLILDRLATLAQN